MNFDICRLLLIALLFSVRFLGCDSTDDGRRAVSGAVTFQGKPLDRGNTMFVPPTGSRSQTGAAITAGRYQISNQQGLLPGIYKVGISSADGDVPAAPNTPPGPSGNFTSVDRIPLNTAPKATLKWKEKISPKMCSTSPFPETHLV